MTPATTVRTGALTGRQAAHQAVTLALRGRAYVQDVLRRLRAEDRLAPREAGLATEVALGAVRHLFTIEHVLDRVGRYVPARVSPELRAALLVAAYQMIWLDRIPLHAAVDEGVELAGRAANRRAAGMVNALLRRLAPAIATRRTPWERGHTRQVRVSWSDACGFTSDVLPALGSSADPVAYMAAATGERPARVAALIARFGPEAAEQALWASQAGPPLVLQVNPMRMERSEVEAIVRGMTGNAAEFVVGEAEFAGGAIFLPSSTSLADLPSFERGGVYVQDQTARRAADLLGAQPGERIFDACAAPGGKSIALALAMNDTGEVWACDTTPERLSLIDENTRRMGLTTIRSVSTGSGRRPRRPPTAGERPLCDPTTTAAPNLDASLPAQFDAALVDAPCSNSGVIARRPEARLRLASRTRLAELAAQQYRLLSEAARRVRPGGRLVYSTCSIEPCENEDIVSGFLSGASGWRLAAQELTLPRWGPRLADWRDGGFAALVEYDQ